MSFKFYQYRALCTSPPFDPGTDKPCMFIKDRKYLVTRATGDQSSVVVDGFFQTRQGTMEYVALTLPCELCRQYLTLEKEIREPVEEV